ncbi:MAG: four helix bundle protein [Patescibacteria group bacterium]
MTKVFLQIAWEIKAINTSKYAKLSEKLNEAGRMLGGWYGQLMKRNSVP